MNAKIKSYYINLDRSTKRNNKFQDQIKTKKLQIERFPATDGSLDTFKKVKNQKLMINVNLKLIDNNIGGDIATFYSHLKLWRYFANSDKVHDYLLVCEDDVILPDNWNNVLKEIILKTPKNTDFLYLYHSKKIAGEMVDSLFMKPMPTMEAHVNTGFVCYLIKKSAASLLSSKILPLDFSKVYNSKRLIYIDHHIKHYYSQLNFYIYIPPIVKHNNTFRSDRRNTKIICANNK